VVSVSRTDFGQGHEETFAMKKYGSIVIDCSNSAKHFRRGFLVTATHAGVGLFSAKIALSQDSKSATRTLSRVWFAPSRTDAETWERSAPEVRRLAIVDMDFKDLVAAESESNVPGKFASPNITAMEVSWASSSAAEAWRLVESREYSKAIDAIKQAISSDLPRWQQKILGASMADCFVGAGQPGVAGRVFVSLCKENPPAFLYASAPLNWFNDRPDNGLIQQAREWLKLETPSVAPLIGAAWLLNTDEAESAKKELAKIAASKVPVFSELAAAQLWRMALPSDAASEVSKWQQARDRMLSPLQLGPSLTIAYKLQAAGLREAAFDEWLRTALTFPSHVPSVRRARDFALELAKSIKSKTEVEQLDTLLRYGDRRE
jgi:hypothetical protein